MTKRIGFAACLTGFALCMLFGVLAALHVVGTDAGFYHQLQKEAGILDYAGISENDLIVLDEALSDYLKGELNALASLEPMSVRGGMQPPFNKKELTHMEDCRRLFRLLWTGIRVSGIAGPLLWTLGCVILKDEKRKIRRAAWLAPLLIAVPLGALALWAVVDFNAAFHFFHEILFTNDLWLLDPRTDLLIRICPESMFMRMGARIGLCGLAWMGILLTIATVFTRVKKERV